MNEMDDQTTAQTRLPDLRTSLRLDALASGALGALLLALAGILDGALGLPTAFSVAVGAGLLGWAALVAWVAHSGHRGGAVEVVLLNAAYVVASVVFAVAGWVDLTALGVVFVLVQAVAVAALMELQILALRRRPEARVTTRQAAPARS